MMTKEEIQEWIDGEERGRKEKPFVYNGSFLNYSLAWSKALKFAKVHNEEEITEEYNKAKLKDIHNSMSDAGYYKALKMVIEYE